MANIMNNWSVSGAELERALASKLKELLGQVKWLENSRVDIVSCQPHVNFDLLVNLPLGAEGVAALCVECKSDLRPNLFPQLAARKFSPPGNFKVVVPVLALPFVSPRIAELCAEHGWSWFDLAGNCRLDIPPVLSLRFTGNPPVYKRPKPVANLSTPEAGRIIRALLPPMHAELRWTQWAMQKECAPKVSIGLVNKVVRHLREQAFIEQSTDGGFRLHDPLKLLYAWRDAYRFDRHHRHSYFTLLSGQKLREALTGLDLETGNHVLYASFSAAEFQAPYVRQSKTWLYVRSQDVPRLETLLAAKSVDSGENLVVLIPDDEGVFYMGDGASLNEQRPGCTNLVQTYVDLWHSGSRGQEAAEALLEQRLKPEWKAVGIKL